MGSPPSHGRHRPRLLPLAGAALLLALVASACLPPRTGWSGPTGGRRLIMIGHSLPNWAGEDLVAALTRTRQASFDTWPGRRIPEAADAIGWAVAEAPDVVVVDLGENDLIAGLSPAAVEVEVAGVLDRLVGIRCVVWIDAVDRPADARPGWSARAAELNGRLRDQAASRPNAHVAGWADHARDRDDWFGPDQLHHTDVGARAYAEFVAAEVDRWCGGAVTGPPTPGGGAVTPR